MGRKFHIFKNQLICVFLMKINLFGSDFNLSAHSGRCNLTKIMFHPIFKQYGESNPDFFWSNGHFQISLPLYFPDRPMYVLFLFLVHNMDGCKICHFESHTHSMI
jgi:hypothetical protein